MSIKLIPEHEMKVEKNVYQNRKGRFDDLMADILETFVSRLHKEIPHQWRIYGSTALYIARNYGIGGDGNNYRFLHTEICHPDGKRTQHFRDIDIVVPSLESYTKIKECVYHLFPGCNLNREVASSYDWDKLHNKIVKTCKFTIPVMSIIDKTSVAGAFATLLRREIPDADEIIFKIDITFSHCDEHGFKGIVPTHLSRSFCVDYNGKTFAFEFVRDLESIPESEFNFRKQTLPAFIQSARYWIHFYRQGNLPGYTQSGDKYIFGMKTEKKLKEIFKPTNFNSRVFDMLRRVLDGYDYSLQSVWKPSFSTFGRLKDESFHKTFTIKHHINYPNYLAQCSTGACSLCQNEYTDEEEVYVTQCGHFFHLGCWLERTIHYYIQLYRASSSGRTYMIDENLPNKFECPLCREDCGRLRIPTSSINPLFHVEMNRTMHTLWEEVNIEPDQSIVRRLFEYDSEEENEGDPDEVNMDALPLFEFTTISNS